MTARLWGRELAVQVFQLKDLHRIPFHQSLEHHGIGMLAIYLNYRKRKQILDLYHQERMAAIEKGIECPPWPDHLLADEAAPPSPSPRRHLLEGLVWLFVGLAGTVAVYATFDLSHALFGLVPAGIGAAHLIYYSVEGRREAEAAERTAAAPRT
ncbi:MAG: DUF6249 domain-containing protein [Limisphaerales bacterium]